MYLKILRCTEYAQDYKWFFLQIVGLIWGYVIQQFSQTIYILGAGLVMAVLITVPPWPMYRCKPLDWQKPQSGVTTKLKKKK